MTRYREARHDLSDSAGAPRQTARRAGGAILIATLATAAGFLAFVQTEFSGVAELGLIAGMIAPRCWHSAWAITSQSGSD